MSDEGSPVFLGALVSWRFNYWSSFVSFVFQLLIFFAVLASFPAESGAQLFARNTCPQKLEVEQRVGVIPEGWEAAQTTATVELASVTFYVGPPSEKAALKYDSEDRQKRDLIAFWNLPPNARGYWISCGYENTIAVISRRLPENTKICSVTYERKRRGAGNLPGIKQITCK
jgi:hypothetical protein